MRAEGLLCDLTLRFGVGSSLRIYKAHRVVVVAVSQTFHMLAQEGSLENHDTFEIKGIEIVILFNLYVYWQWQA